jgi:hypothetical protein
MKRGGIATAPTRSSWSPDVRTVGDGLGGYAHFRAERRLHEPLRADCTFVLIFDGPFDLDLLESPQG